MQSYRVAEAAEVLGVSDDTVRRWIASGRIQATEKGGRMVIAGPDLAVVAHDIAGSGGTQRSELVSARNTFPGIVTAVIRDKVMAQVELACGTHRVVSLMSREAADQLGLEPGVRATASVKSTNVVVERT